VEEIGLPISAGYQRKRHAAMARADFEKETLADIS